MFILDTSVIRSISRINLEAAIKNQDVVTSTLTVLELASHLHDSLDNEKYKRARGNFLKCKLVRIIDDPFWALSQKIQLSVNETRKEDKGLLSQLLSAVEKSETLEQLNHFELIYPDGKKASCKDVGIRISEILKEEEDDYINQIQRLSALANLEASENGKHLLTPDNLLGYMLEASKSLSATSDKNINVKTFLTAAPYLGYLISRLYLYSNCRPVGEEFLTIDRNDCEDAYITLSLDLNSSDTLVTNDKGTLNALRNSASLLNDIHPNLINPNYVMSGEEFTCAAKS